jgi:hypothetical protein
MKPSLRTLRNPLIATTLCAFALRIFAILWLRTYHIPPNYPEPPMSLGDPHFWFGYEVGCVAKSLVTGHGYSSPQCVYGGPTAWIAPVYTLLTAGVFKIFGIYSDASAFVMLTFNSICAALTCIAIIKLGERLGVRRYGIVSAWIWALVPYFFRWTVTVIWETSLSALLMSVAMLWTIDLREQTDMRSWIRYGALWALIALTNPMMMTFLAVAIVWVAWHRLQRIRSEREEAAQIASVAKLRISLLPDLKLGVVASLVFIVGISPWVVRNRLAFGQWVFLRDNFGFELRMGNRHLMTTMGWLGGHPALNPNERAEYARLGELGYIRAKKEAALRDLKEYPGEFAGKALDRVVAFWDGTLIHYSGWNPLWQPWLYAPLSALSLLGTLFLFTRKIPGAGLIAGLMLIYPLPLYITYPLARNGHPMEPIMLIVAVFLTALVCGEILHKVRLVRRPVLAEIGIS